MTRIAVAFKCLCETPGSFVARSAFTCVTVDFIRARGSILARLASTVIGIVLTQVSFKAVSTFTADTIHFIYTLASILTRVTLTLVYVLLAVVT